MAWHHNATKISGLTASQLRLAVKAGQLPPPVVIGQRLRKRYTQSPLSLYRALRCINPSPYMYYYLSLIHI